MRTILVPLGGGDSDAAVLTTAFAVAGPLGAHMELLHVHQRADQAAVNTPHIGFATGEALRSALGELRASAERRVSRAEEQARAFCARHGVPLVETPQKGSGPTARWRREEGEAVERLLYHARHNDLTVLARPRRPDGLPADRIERLLRTSGRPVLLAPDGGALTRIGTIVVCWQEAAHTARALSVASPILAKAARAVVLCVDEGGTSERSAIDDLAVQLSWHGIATEARIEPRGGRPIAEALMESARAAGADLVVMGGYSHTRLREMLFGGCTQSIIEGANVAVLMLH